jgi:hypothetical protein
MEHSAQDRTAAITSPVLHEVQTLLARRHKAAANSVIH